MKALTDSKQAIGKLWMVGALVCLLTLVLPLAVHAQQYSGTITGTVADSSGASVPGAAVTATNKGNGSVYSTTSSEQGLYTFAQLPVGSYDVLVKKAGFKDFLAKDV